MEMGHFYGIVLLQVLGSLSFTNAFLAPQPASQFRIQLKDQVPVAATSLGLAQRKRRRRKSQTPVEIGGDGDTLPDFDMESSPDLPDFDLNEDEEEKSKPRPVKVSNPDEITPAMMGSTSLQDKSIRDLITDRSLESKFEFDGDTAEVEQSVPDFVDLARASGGQIPQPIGKKKARQAARKAAAVAAKEAEESEKNPLSNIPFITDSKGNVSVVKILEAGAWSGIFLLVAWEIYINSPLFDRAAPMVPVVYEFLL